MGQLCQLTLILYRVSKKKSSSSSSTKREGSPVAPYKPEIPDRPGMITSDCMILVRSQTRLPDEEEKKNVLGKPKVEVPEVLKNTSLFEINAHSSAA